MNTLLTRLMLHRPVNREGDRGAGLVEYALLVALIAMVCFVAVTYLGDDTSQSFSDTAESITNA